MSFMEDLGRSNAVGGINRVFDKAIDIRRGEDQSAERAYTLGMETEKLGLAKEAAGREAAKFGWEQKKQKEQEAIDNIPTPITALVGTGWENDPAKKHQVDKFKELGLVTEPIPGLLMTTGKNAKAFKEYAQNNLEFTLQNSALRLQGLKGNLERVGAALAGDKDAVKALGLNPEELAAKKAEIEKQISAAVASHLAVDTKHQEALQLAKAKSEGKIYKGPGGGLYRLKEDGTTEELVAPPEKEAKAPTTRNRDVGDKQITEEWKDGAWVKVGEAPRWNERGGKREDRLAANQQFKNERDMRQDFEKLPEVKNFNETNIKAGQMAQAIEESKTTNNFVAVDQALITMFNKMTDPQSVVRESEYARTSNDIATVNMIKGKAQKVLTGGAGLTSAERDALKTMSDRFLAASKERYDSVAEEYRGLAKTYGYEPNNVVFRGTAKKGGGGVKTADEFFKKYGGK